MYAHVVCQTTYCHYKYEWSFLLLQQEMMHCKDDVIFQITIQRDSGLDVSAPKHGKIDPMNAPHVGGNQWAGGTGRF